MTVTSPGPEPRDPKPDPRLPLFIHAQDAQEIAGDREKQAEVWDDLKNLRQLFQATPWQRGQTALQPLDLNFTAAELLVFHHAEMKLA